MDALISPPLAAVRCRPNYDILAIYIVRLLNLSKLKCVDAFLLTLEESLSLSEQNRELANTARHCSNLN